MVMTMPLVYGWKHELAVNVGNGIAIPAHRMLTFLNPRHQPESLEESFRVRKFVSDFPASGAILGYKPKATYTLPSFSVFYAASPFSPTGIHAD
jgi:hypothetical protein